jgi:anthranilate phosphoribosyltransferase
MGQRLHFLIGSETAMSIQNELRRILEQRQTLSREEASALMQSILAGHASDIELAALLGALAARGETSAEIAGFASALRDAANILPLSEIEQQSLVDTCGTGGDASGSFNISTAAALVAAAADGMTASPRKMMIAKHGNRAVTSLCGSADVLEALGIPIQLSPADAATALRTHNFAFLLAPSHHPQLKAVMPVRKALGVRSILHILGPLLNPAGARRQVMGVYQSRLVPLVANAMILLDIQHAMVVHGDGGSASGSMGIDELALSGPSEIAELRNGTITQYTITPEEFGLARAPLSELAGGNASDNALILKAIFSGKSGPHRDVVLLNAAAVLVVGGLANTLRDGINLAATTIDSGAVTQLVNSLQGT